MIAIADVPLPYLIGADLAAVVLLALRGITLVPAARRLHALGVVGVFSLVPWLWWLGLQDLRSTLVWATALPLIMLVGSLGHTGYLRRYYATPAGERPAKPGPRDWVIALQITAAAVAAVIGAVLLLQGVALPKRGG
ncbi:hypothetical protein J0910_15955 [Nocardiopsis sp. CNT-189]|uniref:hypothetical protein n=1 Tax=Nocardiopsis oceanisediminis TaxID=2816862 RepID=UPI003B31F1B2